jgi:hypothetical protein
MGDLLEEAAVRFPAIFTILSALRLPSGAFGQDAPPAVNPLIFEIVDAVSADRIGADIRTLVSFGTRNTFSDTLSTTRGIGAARRWIKGEFDRISIACGGCLDVMYISEVIPASRRVPEATSIVNVVAIQRGTTDPNRMIVMSGDIDSRISSGSNAIDSAPGANDNASGMAGTIEAARVLSQHRFNGSIVYMGLSGEEQGLWGGQIVARHALANDWNIVGVLNNDMIGNIEGISGVVENTTARVFSDPTPMSHAVRARVDSALGAIRQLASGETVMEGNDTLTLDRALGRIRSLTEAQWSLMRRQGGEIDGSSRQLARYVDKMADLYLPTLDVMMIYRLDRFGRGGHHTPFANVGFPGVRIMESNENYNRQHQNIRFENGIHYGDVIEGVNFEYAAKLTALNAVTMASLAWAPGPPTHVRINGAVRPAATLIWEPAGDAGNVAGYRVFWRATDSPTWDHSRWVGTPRDFEALPSNPAFRERLGVTAETMAYRFNGLVIDNYFFGVAAVAADGSESTVVFPLP